jgi:poly-beta-1,6-N-acetyl-D-glucosamine synthase
LGGTSPLSFLEILQLIDETLLYRVALIFYGFYPMAMALVWVVLAAIYFHRRERSPEELAPPDFHPFVSVIIPAFEEERTIARTIEVLLELDYPDFEVIIVNDGSSDRTSEVVSRYLASGKVRLLDKEINEGKAMALNDALPLCRGEILLFLDSDILVSPSLLKMMVPHFAGTRVGAVTGNPRVANRGSLLRDLQALEFTSIISVQRRAQRIWGRVLTASGAVMALRKSAILELGGFSPRMATEDIDITWRLQRAFWDVRYEPSAVVWMQVPPTLPELWKQRRRWARGLAQVLVRHRTVVTTWTNRRLWPVYYEAAASIVWAYVFLFITAYWVASFFAGHAPMGASPIPNIWGMMIATACLTQLLAGVLMDRRYDRGLFKRFPIAIFYPLIYWMLMSLITSIYTLDGFFRKPPQTQRWRIGRAAAAFACVLLLPSAVSAQTAEEWIGRGDVAASEDRHAEAIAGYQRAIELEPSLRTSLLPKLGRQWLWSDDPGLAARLLGEAIASGETDCGVRSDYGLALAWSDQLGDARAVYREVIADCPDVRDDTRLRLGLVERWRDRPSAAAEVYQSVMEEGSTEQRDAAAAGLAHVAMMRGHEREALTLFERIDTPAGEEGAILALARLGENAAARERIASFRSRDPLTGDLERLDRRLSTMNDPQLEAGALLFDDADGTRFIEMRLGGTIGWSLRGRGGISIARWDLEDGTREIEADRVAISAEHRFTPAWAVVGSVAFTDYEDPDWSPTTGELRAVHTPDDRTRWDFSVARLLVPDNVAATVNRLEGTYLSAGIDREIANGLTITLGADWTDWSTGNERFRVYGGPRLQLEGVPRVTIEWPTLLMFYDQGFDFGLFSPEEYIETGPGVNVYRRFSPQWSGSLYGRAGMQKETGRSWEPIGVVRGVIERELDDDWALRATAGWSNSNLASTSGFRRTSVTLDLIRRF